MGITFILKLVLLANEAPPPNFEVIDLKALHNKTSPAGSINFCMTSILWI